MLDRFLSRRLPAAAAGRRLVVLTGARLLGVVASDPGADGQLLVERRAAQGAQRRGDLPVDVGRW